MSGYIDPALVPKRRLYTGEQIPCIGMGTFGSDHVSPQQVSAAVAGAIRGGYRLIDCASVYGNEKDIGAVFDDVFSSGKAARSELFIIGKLWNDRHGRGKVLVSCAQTLDDLRLDYLDAYFVHWPFPNYHAPMCGGDSRNPDSKPFITEDFMLCWRQMERLHDMGLVRNLGMSNMTVPKLKAVLPLCRIKPALLEMELHPAFQQTKLFEYALAQGIQPVGFCPVGSPARPERDKTSDDAVATELPAVKAAAAAHGIHPATVCLKWAAQRGQIPIPFSVNEAHYIDNLRCVTCDPLSDSEMAAIAAQDADCRLIKGQVFLWPGAHSWHDLWDEDGTITK
jgi:alcohol dehydrogenase (NADP+)